MKTIIVTMAIITSTSVSFAGTACKHTLNMQGNTLLANTAAPSSTVAATQNGSEDFSTKTTAR